MCDDEWTFTQEQTTIAQVEALNALLALPWREADFYLSAEDEDDD